MKFLYEYSTGDCQFDEDLASLLTQKTRNYVLLLKLGTDWESNHCLTWTSIRQLPKKWTSTHLYNTTSFVFFFFWTGFKSRSQTSEIYKTRKKWAEYFFGSKDQFPPFFRVQFFTETEQKKICSLILLHSRPYKDDQITMNDKRRYMLRGSAQQLSFRWIWQLNLHN